MKERNKERKASQDYVQKQSKSKGDTCSTSNQQTMSRHFLGSRAAVCKAAAPEDKRLSNESSPKTIFYYILLLSTTPYGMEYSIGSFLWDSYRLLGVLERQLWCCVGAAHSSQHVVCYQHPPGYKCRAQHFQRNVNPTQARATTLVPVVTPCGAPSSGMC